ncbi:MAG: hypothetical protein HOY76_06650 [Streptomyces sp.]|nr:hypothetical protein [Streptomyces sp.]NUR00143.1 hypothetical protein [Streptomyces sp.]
MSSDTLAKVPAAPDIPEQADALRVLRNKAFQRDVVTSVLGVARYHVEKHYARGSERAR